MAGLPRAALWTLGVLAGLIVLLFIASFFVDEPMRRSMERRMNQRLTGYTVRLPRLNFRLLGLSVTLYDLTVSQQAHPDPPVAVIPKLHASVQWRELLTGHIVSDFLLDKPRIRVNLPQLRKEASDSTPVKDRGWQQDRGGDLSVQDQPPARQRRGLRVHRRRVEKFVRAFSAGDPAVPRTPPAAAPHRAPVAVRQQHPQHSLEGADLPLPGARRRGDLRDGPWGCRRPRGFPGPAVRGRPCRLQGREGPARKLPPHLSPLEPGVAKLRGKFMGSGPSVAHFHYRPRKSGPDFDLDLAIKDTRLTAMNDILRAYGKFDVTAGTFSFYSQLRAKNGQMTGYIKPLFAGMKVYDSEQDKENSFFHKLYEMIVGGIANLLENKNNDIATQADISGPVGNAKASVWQIIGRAFENAFIKAILPGFEKRVERLRGKR